MKNYLVGITHEVHENLGKKSTNGPDGTISAKTLQSVDILDFSVNMMQRECKMNDESLSNINLRSCLTLQVESLHSIHHLKNTDMLEYVKAFGSTIKETLKRVC